MVRLTQHLLALICTTSVLQIAQGADPYCTKGTKHPDGIACCSALCPAGKCGATDCSTYGADKCCSSAIKKLNRSCNVYDASCVRSTTPVVNPAPPTTGTADPTCALGIKHPNATNLACCALSCGAKCGASDCSSGGEGLCCGSGIKASGRSCNSTSAPCMRSTTTTTPTTPTNPTPPAAPINDYTAPTPAKLLLTCTKPGMVALTFDDGTTVYNKQIRDALNAKGVKATFYINGANFRYLEEAASKADLKTLYDQGHQIASHTWGHKNLSTGSAEERKQQMCKLDVAIAKVIGVTPRHMRPPFGDCNAACLQALSGWGYLATNWNLDSRDWENKNAKASLQYYITAMGNADPLKGSFVALNHEVLSTATDLVRDLIAYIDSLPKDWKFVTMAECLGEPAYRPNPWNKGKAGYGSCSCNANSVCTFA